MIDCKVLLYFFLFSSISFLANSKCLGWCNKHGICTSADETGYCICDFGYTAPDCSIRMCPKAYDPYTLEERKARRQVRLTTSHQGGKMYGSIIFDLGGSTIQLKANANMLTSQQCTEDFKRLKTASEVTCTRESFDPEKGTGSYLITFLKWPLYPAENNIFTHIGNPPLENFLCNTTKVDKEEAKNPTCKIEDTVTESVPDYYECAGHGSCNRQWGNCTCNRGYYGPVCDSTLDNEDRMVVSHDGLFFTANILKLEAFRDPSPDFHLLSAEVATAPGEAAVYSTRLRGDGWLMHRGNMQINGSTILQGSSSSSSSGSSGDVNANILVIRGGKGTAPVSPMCSMLRTEVFGSQSHYQAYYNQEEVLSIDAHGTLTSTGGLSVGNGTLTAVSGFLTAQNVKVTSSLDVRGAIHLEESLTLGASFVLTPEGMTVDVAKHSGSLLELKSGQVDFNGSLLEIHGERGGQNSLIRTVVGGDVVFDLSSAGVLSTRSLVMETGGVVVSAGGVRVAAGGLVVSGGVTIASGGLHLSETYLEVQRIQVESDHSALSVLEVTASSPSFVGSVLELTSHSTDSQSVFLAAKDKGGGVVSSLSGDGTWRTKGGLVVGGPAALTHSLGVGGSLSLHRQSVAANDTIALPARAAYVTITSDEQTGSRNELQFPSSEEGAEAGQLLFVSNGDEDPTSSPTIPPGCMVGFLFNGSHWIDISALKAPVEVLRGVKLLEAANDLSIGNHTLGTGRLRLLAMTRGAIPVVGLGGMLAEHPGLTYAKGVLSVTAANIGKLVADVDGGGNGVSNIMITDSRLKNVTITASNFSLPGATGLAVFNKQGLLTVSKGLSLDDQSRVILTDIGSDVDMHGHVLTNVTLQTATLKDIRFAQIQDLVLSGQTTGGIVRIGEGGRLTSDSALRLLGSELQVERVSGFTLGGPVDVNGQSLSDVRITSGSISGLERLTAEKIVIPGLALALPPSDRDGDRGRGSRILLVTSGGELTADIGEEIQVENLVVKKLSVQEDLDMVGGTISNAVLQNVTLGALPLLSVLRLTLPAIRSNATSRSNATGEGDKPILTVDHLGDVTVLEGISVDKGSLTVTSAVIANLHASTVRLHNTSSSFLYADEQGVLRGSRDLNASTVNTTGLSVVGEARLASLRLTGGLTNSNANQSFTLTSLLTMDASGAVTPSTQINISSLTLTGGLTTPSLQIPLFASLSVLSTDSQGFLTGSNSLSAEHVSASRVTVRQSLVLEGLAAGGGGGSDESPSLLVLGVNGTVGRASGVTIPSLDVTDVRVAGTLNCDSLRLSHRSQGEAGGGGGGVLMVNASGHVTASRELSLADITAASVVVEKQLVLRGLTSALLSVSAQGVVTGATDLNVTRISTANLTVTGGLEASHIRLLGGQSAPPSALSLDGEGNLVQTSDITLNSLDTSYAVVRGGLSASTLTLTDTSTLGSLLSVNALGRVVGTDLVNVSSLQSQQLNVSHATVTQLHLPELLPFSLLSLDSEGGVTTTEHINVTSIHAKTLDVDSLITVGGLRFREAAVMDSLLTVDDSGSVTGTRNLSIDSVHLSGAIWFASFEVGDTNISSVLTVGPGGEVSVTKNLTLSSVTADESLVQRLVVSGDVRLPGLASSALLSVDGSGNLVAAPPSLEVSALTAPAVTVTDTGSGSGGLRLAGLNSSLLYADQRGVVVAARDIVVESASMTSLAVSGTAAVGGLRLSGFVSAALAVDEAGNVVAADTLLLQMVSAAHVVVQDTLIVQNVQINSLVSSLLGTDESGVLVEVTDLNVTDITADSVTAVHLTAGSLTLTGGAPASLLMTDASGGVVAVPPEAVSVSEGGRLNITASTLTVMNGLQLLDVASRLTHSEADRDSPGFLTIHGNGTVEAVRELTLNYIQATNIQATNSIQTGELQLASLPSKVLGTDGEGKVVGLESLWVAFIESENSSVTGTAQFHQIRLTNMTSGLLMVSEEGLLTSTDRTGLRSLQAEQAELGHVLISHSLVLKSLSSDSTNSTATSTAREAPYPSRLLVVAGNGEVHATSALNQLKEISTLNLSVTASLEAESIRVNSMALSLSGEEIAAATAARDSDSDSDSAMRLVVADSNGNLVAVSVDEVVTRLPDNLTVAALQVAGTTRLQSLVLTGLGLGEEKGGSWTGVTAEDSSSGSGSGSGIPLGVTEAGEVTAIDSSAWRSLTTTALSVRGTASLSSLRLPSLPAAALLTVNATGSLVAAGGVLLTDRYLEIEDVAIHRLHGAMDGQGHSLRNVLLEGGRVVNSTISLGSGSGSSREGAVTITGKDGSLQESDLLYHPSTHTLHLSALTGTLPTTSLRITRAALQDSSFSGSNVTAATVTTGSLQVTSTASFEQDLYVGGSAVVQGTVTGSGPYFDSSDRRFKADISPLAAPLDKLVALSGVTYTYRTEEFPAKNFPPARQIGWLADEVVAVFPELVSADAEGFQYVSYSHAVPVLSEAIKALRGEVLELRQKLADVTTTRRAAEPQSAESLSSSSSSSAAAAATATATAVTDSNNYDGLVVEMQRLRQDNEELRATVVELAKLMKYQTAAASSQ